MHITACSKTKTYNFPPENTIITYILHFTFLQLRVYLNSTQSFIQLYIDKILSNYLQNNFKKYSPLTRQSSNTKVKKYKKSYDQFYKIK